MTTGELVEGRSARILFDSGSAVVPADTSVRLSGVLGTLGTDPATQVRVSGFHDASGDAAANEALAKQRAEAIQQWLVVNGVAVERITLDKPAQTTGSGDADEARRVDVRVE
ncbi:OmpA family protein [Pseudoxanthomonas sp. LH2527]|uniref:OmpA family protein n=1 Tax=Pseudoxanthomonas sp. LH2527 TaxID=2923249 RepID=UPI001F146337|nr:OmpA family protein [Pseudoxanthomonas sp. LH2527]MCH6482603.1 OmpA family protein [Pseudoxanthomonas sp. LH2527]